MVVQDTTDVSLSMYAFLYKMLLLLFYSKPHETCTLFQTPKYMVMQSLQKLVKTIQHIICTLALRPKYMVIQETPFYTEVYAHGGAK